MICACQAAAPSRLLSTQAVQWAGERSYSIYLLHPFVIFLLFRGGVYSTIYEALGPSMGNWSYFPCVGLALRDRSLCGGRYVSIDRGSRPAAGRCSGVPY